MRSPEFARIGAAFGAALLVVAACQPAGPAVTKEGEVVTGGRIVDAAISDIKTLNPVLSSDTASGAVWQRIYLPLTRVNPDDGRIEPFLAEKFELSSDGLTLTYTLRDGLVWSDGVPFTGEDYKYTAEAVMRSKKTVRKGTFESVVGAKDYEQGKANEIAGIQVKQGGKIVEVKFTKVFCPAVSTLGGAGAGGVIPKHHFSKYWDSRTTDTSTNVDDNPLNVAPPASMGPFIFKEYRPGDQVTLVRNEKYFLGAPNVDEFIVKVYADTTVIKAALIVGEVSFSSADPRDWEELSRYDHLKGSRFGGLGSTYIGWNPNNTKVPWLADKRFRQALQYGLNVDQVVERVLLGFGKRVFAYSVPLQWSYDEAGLNKYPYDPNKAKQLIESTGAKLGPDGVYRWTDGRPITVKIETNSGNLVRESLVQIAQEQYGKIGVKVDPLLESFPALTENTRYGKSGWEGFILGFSYGIDPDPHGIWHSSQSHATGFNRVGWNKTDALIDAQRNGPDCSIQNRKSVIHDIDKLLNEDVPWTFLWTGDAIVFSQKNIQNFDPKPYSTASLWNVEKWWIKR